MLSRRLDDAQGALNETLTAISTSTHSRRMRMPYTILAAQSVLVREIKMQQTEDEVATDLVGQAEEVTDREEADDEIETARQALVSSRNTDDVYG